MKKTLLFFCTFFFCFVAEAQDVYTFCFSKDDYSLSTNKGITRIGTIKQDVYYSDDHDSPSFPYSGYCILRPSGVFSNNFEIKIEKNLLLENVDLEASPKNVTTDMLSDSLHIRIATHSVHNPVVFGGDQLLGTYNYAYFKITPFLYDINTKNLYFVSKIAIILPSEPENDFEIPKSDYEIKPIDAQEIKQLVVNPEDLDKFYLQNGNISKRKLLSPSNNNVDYLIITSKKLKNEFNSFVTQKIRKGLRTKVLTVEDIYAEYGLDLYSKELCIKKKIYQYYYSKGLKWVLLGGDTSVVPSLMCKIKTKDKKNGNFVDSTTPTDLFYACFGGTFNWDKNGNGVFGEVTDNISLYPNVYVSRIPARIHGDLTKYFNKLVRYEKSLNPNYSKFLLAAKDCDYTGNGNSTFANTSESMADNFIKNSNYYVWANRNYLYDNSSNIPGYNNLTVSNLFNAINDNIYHHIYEDSHGSVTSFVLTNDISNISNISYDRNNAFSQTNSHPFILTTSACLTNAFDNNTSCLSHSLLCNTYGCIAFYGSSRDAWAKESGISNISATFNGFFYKCLFESQPQSSPNRFAAIVAESKKKLISEANTSDDSPYRWLQFSMNPMGDPELPIFTELPTLFNNPLITCEGSSVTVNTGGVDHCTIAITSIDDGADYFSVAHDVDSYTFNDVISPFIVTISKENHITYESDTLYTLPQIQGKSILCGYESYSVDSNVPDGFTLNWILQNQPSGVTITSSGNTCTVNNELRIPIDTYLYAILTRGNYRSICKKRVVTHPEFSVTCSQSTGNVNGITYSKQDNVIYDSAKGFVVNPGCEITLFSGNFKCMTMSYEGANPTSFYHNGTNLT